MKLLISNRRYTGSKSALLHEIYDSIKKYHNRKTTFADLFAGTGVVSAFMLEKGMNVIVNDTLKSNYVAYKAWLDDKKYDLEKTKEIIDRYNKVDGDKLKDNYFSKIYGRKYFSISDAKKIGYIRDRIEKEEINEREKSILLSSLMYATDKIANTVGHFEHYLSKEPVKKDVILRLPEIIIIIKNGITKLYKDNLVRKDNFKPPALPILFYISYTSNRKTKIRLFAKR